LGILRTKDVAVRTSPRPFRAIAPAVSLALSIALLAACGSSGSSGSSTDDTTPGAQNTVASKLVLGGAPTCPTREYCQIGLKEKYGLEFKSFKSLDTGGPLTVAALENDSIQVGLIFTTDGIITAKGWVLLEDDKVLQPADNVTPVLNNEAITAYGDELTGLINQVTEKITTEGLTELNKSTGIDKKDSDDVAKAWLDDNGFTAPSPRVAKTGPTITVGSGNFGETITLANIYADWLERNGYPVKKKLDIGSREIYFPLLKKGDLSLVPEYAGTLITYLNPDKPATTDPEANATALATALEPLKLTALNFSSAQDINGFVVTKETADKYGLVKLSDLAKPAS
jgi:osmoprotectant transport system substrate-binding protein